MTTPKTTSHSKVAHLFLVYRDVAHPTIWEHYFCGVNDKHTIYCHAAFPDETKTPWLQQAQIKTWVSTGWGKLGLVVAHLELLRAALEDVDNQRFVLVSDTCVPIKSLQYVHEVAHEYDASWITCYRQYLARMRSVTTIPSGYWQKHSQWVLLTREHAELLCHNNFVQDFAQCGIPDEHYVGTVLSYLGVDNLLRREQTHVWWRRLDEDCYVPIEHQRISNQNVQGLRQSPSLFARKFPVGSNIKDRIDDIVC